MQQIQGNILEHKKILAKSFLKTSKKHWWFHLSQISGWLSVWRKYMRLLGLDLPVLYSIPLNISGGGTQNDKIIQVYILHAAASGIFRKFSESFQRGQGGTSFCSQWKEIVLFSSLFFRSSICLIELYWFNLIVAWNSATSISDGRGGIDSRLLSSKSALPPSCSRAGDFMDKLLFRDEREYTVSKKTHIQIWANMYVCEMCIWI